MSVKKQVETSIGPIFVAAACQSCVDKVSEEIEVLDKEAGSTIMLHCIRQFDQDYTITDAQGDRLNSALNFEHR